MAIHLAHSETPPLDWHEQAVQPRSWTAHAPAPLGASATARTRDNQFAALQAAYENRGGLARGDVLATRMSATGRGGYVDLARRIVARQLFSFQWRDSFWLPMFQFDRHLLTLREAPRRVLDELRAALDGWEIAHWYVQRCDGLDGRRPLDVLELDLDAVLAAARARAVAR